MQLIINYRYKNVENTKNDAIIFGMENNNNVLTCNSLYKTASSLEDYLRWINQIPMLTHQEETDLAKQLINNGDISAGKRLILSHLRFVVKIARNYLGYGLALADLIQEGTLGLMKAVQRFNPERGVRLVTFAIHWIKAEIHDFILHNWRIVKIATTKAQRKLFFNLRKKNKALNWFTAKEIKEIASDLEVPEKEVKMMEARMSAGDLSLDVSNNEENSNPPIEYLIKTENLEENDDEEEQTRYLAQLKEHLKKLDPRSRDIVQQRWLSSQKMTLQALSDKYHVSCERVRQIEEKAMITLRHAMQ